MRKTGDMGHISQRFGIEIGRGWVILFLLAAIIVGAAYGIGPLRPLPPELRLLAVDGEAAVTELAVSGTVGDEGVLRFPVRLAVQNVGAQAAQPRQIVLNVPGRFRVATQHGRLPGDVTPGVPLHRYVVNVTVPELAPNEPPQTLTGLETIWLEPDLPRYYCTAQNDGVPEFVPAPRFDPEIMSDVQIFYSVHSNRHRNTGLLKVRVDASQLGVEPAAMPPLFPTVFEEPEATVPELGALRYGGTRTAWCGDPEQPMELYIALWETAANARFYVIHVDGQPRKHLYDLNGDGIIELETWDASGDGRFEARRQARYAVPEFLRPLPGRRPDLLLPDTVAPDSAWLELFSNTAAGPLRFAEAEARAAEARAAAARAAAARAAAAAQTAAPGSPPYDTATGMPGERRPFADIEPLPPPDSAWLELFLDAGAGPFRFSRGIRAAADDDAGTTPAPRAPGTTSADTVAVPDTVTVDTAQPPPPPRRSVPLGTPVPIRPPGGGVP
ncbi:hypothetical protein BH23GEM9_BH23GEM9_36570 [soil metagenome]